LSTIAEIHAERKQRLSFHTPDMRISQKNIKIILDFHLLPQVWMRRALFPTESGRVSQELDIDILKCKGGRYALEESGGFFLSVIVFIRL
jgi:hypothetical protein